MDVLLSASEAAQRVGVSRTQILWLCRHDPIWKKKIKRIMDGKRVLTYKIPLELVDTYRPNRERQAIGRASQQEPSPFLGR